MDDRETTQLDLLVTFQYVFTAMLVFGGLASLVQIAMGGSLLDVSSSIREDFDDTGWGMLRVLFDWVMLLIPGCMLIVFWGPAVATFLCARCLQTRAAHRFCVVIAAIACAIIPLGTVLGVFTLATLMRSSVRQEFDVELQSF